MWPMFRLVCKTLFIGSIPIAASRLINDYFDAGFAYNRDMTRLVLSVMGGVVIPFLYAVIVGPLTNYIENPRLRELATYPVRWPIITLEYFLPLSSFPFGDEHHTFLLLFIIVSDVLLYSLLSYILLWRFAKPKTQQMEPPPDPPRFTSNENAEGSP